MQQELFARLRDNSHKDLNTLSITQVMTNSTRIAIATMTYDKKGDAELMRETLRFLASKGHQAYIADGGSSTRFLDDLRLMGHEVVQVPGGLTCQHINSIQRAAGNAKTVLYMEPDKFKWVSEHLEEAIDKYFSMREGPDIFAVVSRTSDQMNTFPPHQRTCEGLMNDLIHKKTGFKGDSIYGPKVFSSKLAAHLNELSGKDLGWAGLMFSVGRAYNLGMPLRSIEAASECPSSQTSEDKNAAAYRERQFKQNALGLYLGLGETVPAEFLA